MRTRNAQRKNTKLKLNRISIVNLTPLEMIYVNGGASIVVTVNTGTGGGGTNTITTTKTVQSMAPSAPCTGEPGGPYISTISFQPSVIG